MTPLRLRLFVLTFFAVATAISFNALYMQDAPHIANIAARQPDAEPQIAKAPATASLPQEGRAAKSAPIVAPEPVTEEPAPVEVKPTPPVEAKPNLPIQEKENISPELVRAVERELSRRGYNPGAIDGELDIGTRAAIIAYEFDEGLPLKGEPSQAILKTLIFGTAAGKAGPGPADRFERRRELVRQVQDALAKMGYTSGPIDGQFDISTRDAIRKFETDRNLTGQGRLTARILLELVIVAGHPFNLNS